METRRLKYFARIADDGSLMKAAGVLRIAQPALSRQLRLLEEELGVQLFQRTSRGMQLTEHGERLRAAIAGPLRELELALQSIRSTSLRVEGHVTIGMPSGIGDALARSMVLRLDAELPNVRLRVVEGINGSLIDWLIRGVVDFALLEEAASDERVSNRELRREPLVLVGPASSSLSSRRAVPFRDVARLPLIVPSHHMGIRGALDAAARKVRRNLNIRFEVDSVPLARDLVERDMGYAVLPHAYFSGLLAEGRCKQAPINGPALWLPTYLSRRNYHPANPGVATAIEQAILAFIDSDTATLQSRAS